MPAMRRLTWPVASRSPLWCLARRRATRVSHLTFFRQYQVKRLWGFLRWECRFDVPPVSKCLHLAPQFRWKRLVHSVLRNCCDRALADPSTSPNRINSYHNALRQISGCADPYLGMDRALVAGHLADKPLGRGATAIWP